MSEDFLFERGNEINTGTHGEHDYVFASGDPLPDNGGSALVFESGVGVGGAWHTVSSIPNAQAEHLGTDYNGKIYVAGGDLDERNNPERHYMYDPDSDSWTRLADMPTPRESGVAGAYNGQIFYIGGRRDESPAQSKIVEIYDIGTDSWSQGTDSPYAIENCSFGQSGSSLYIGGAFADRSISDPYTTTYKTLRYDMASDSWTELADMPHSISVAPGEVAEGVFWICGGKDETVDEPEDWLYGYDIASDTWTQYSNMGTPREGALFSQGDGGLLYAIGGTNDTGTLGSVERYDIAADSWTPLGTAMPTARGGTSFCDAVIDGRIYVVAGSDDGTKLTTVEYLQT